MATRLKRRKSKVVEKENDVMPDGQSSEQVPVPVEEEPTESTVAEENQKDEEDQHEQDPPMDIEVKGNTPTVNMSWEKKSEEGEEKKEEDEAPTVEEISSSDQTAVKETQEKKEHSEVTSSADAADATDEAPSQTPEAEKEQEAEGCADEEGSQMDVVVVVEDDQSVPTAAAPGGNETEQGENKGAGKKSRKRKKKTLEKKAVTENDEQTAKSVTETTPSKKRKLTDDEFCLHVGNLNNSKTYGELRKSLEDSFMNQSFQCQQIRLVKSKKHAFVSLASETDLATALTLDGEMIFDKPMKVAKAKVRNQDSGKLPAPAGPPGTESDDGRLFVKNLPVTTTKEQILKVFPEAVEVQFPGGKEFSSHGNAFVEFPNKAIAEKILQGKEEVKIEDQVLIVGHVRGKKKNAGPKIKVDANTEAANDTLYVSNLPHKVKESDLQKAFPKAVSVVILQDKGKSKNFAFVQFKSIKDAKKALNASENLTICEQAATVQFCDQPRPKDLQVLSKTLIVMRLAAETTAETLQSAFEGAYSARLVTDHNTGRSRRFGFVEFENEDTCKAAKDAMEDCLINGSRVAVAYAKAKANKTGTKESNKKGSSGVGQKRKANSAPKTPPPKKPKAKNNGFCLLVGNLNFSKSDEQIRISLANCLMNESLLFEDIRLNRFKKQALVDLASEADLNKALQLDGASILDKPVKISKAQINSGEVKVKTPPANNKGSGGGKKKRGKKGKKGGGPADPETQDPIEEVQSNN